MSDQPVINNKPSKKKFTFKGYLITGILVWMPIGITFWVVGTVIGTLDSTIMWLPESIQPKNLFGYNIPGLGVAVSILVLLGTGIFAANVLGQRIIDGWDRLLSRIPVVKTIYSSVKQVSDTLLSDSSQSFKTPVLVQFPHSGAWTLAFVTGSVPEQIIQQLSSDPADEFLSVYVPTTPNPTSGYFILVNKKDTKELDMSVDEALKYVISLGMVGGKGKQNTAVTEISPTDSDIKSIE